MGVSEIAKLLQEGGPWGLLIALLSISLAVNALLWKVARKDGKELRAEIAALHESRVKDVATLAEQTATGLAKANGAMVTQAAELASSVKYTQQVLDIVRVLPSASEAQMKQIEANANRLDGIKDMLRERR